MSSNLILLFLLEVVLFVAAGKIAMLLLAPSRPTLSEFASSVIAVKLFIAALTSCLVVELTSHEGAAYVCVAVGLAVFATFPSRAWGNLNLVQTSAFSKRDLAVAAVSAGAFGYLVSVCIQPLFEIDSQGMFNAMHAWVQNGTSVYDFPYNYTSFWELQYLPFLLFGPLKQAMWWISAQPLALIWLLTYRIARQCEVPRTAALVVSAACLALPTFWFVAPSGLATLKNDAIANAGLLMAVSLIIAVASRTTRPDLGAALLFGIALSFATTKYAGVIAGVLLAGSYVWACASAGDVPRRKLALSIALVCLTALVGTGHFYIKNLLTFGNPLYPFQIGLGPFKLDGPYILKGTSILENITDPQLWRIWFTSTRLGVHQLGLLFPLVFCATPLVILYAAVTRKSFRWRTIGIALAFNVVLWLIFARSFWSAGVKQGDYLYLRDFMTIRYVTAGVALSYIVVVAVLAELFRPFGVVIASIAIALDAILKIAGIIGTVFHPLVWLDAWHVFFIILFVAFAFALLQLISRGAQLGGAARHIPIGWSVAVLMLGVALLSISTPLFARNETVARSPFALAEQAITREQPLRVYVLVTPETEADPEFWLYTYHALGRGRPPHIVPINNAAAIQPGCGDMLALFASTNSARRIGTLTEQRYDAELGARGWTPVSGDAFSRTYHHRC